MVRRVSGRPPATRSGTLRVTQVAAGAAIGLASLAFAAPAQADPSGTADLAATVRTSTVPAGADTSIDFAFTDHGPDPGRLVRLDATIAALHGARVEIENVQSKPDEGCGTDGGQVGCFRDHLAAGDSFGPADLFELHVIVPAGVTGPVATVHLETDEAITDPNPDNDSVDVTITATGGSASPSAPASPSVSASASASAAPTASTSPSTTPSAILAVPVSSPSGSPTPAAAGELPVTGVDLTRFATVGGGLLLAGAALLFVARRRKDA